MKVYQRNIVMLDAAKNKSYLRQLEMLIEGMTTDQGIVLQFFKDLKLYGLDEAIIYLRQYFETNPKDWPKLEELVATIKEQVKGLR